MKKQIITTADGSKTIHFPEWNESYHSKHGAIQEAQHVYIKSGLDFRCKRHQSSSLSVLEFGFGTGLNAYLTAIYAKENQVKITYHSVEKFPLSQQEISDFNFDKILKTKQIDFNKLHETEWESPLKINDSFQLKKILADFQSFTSKDKYDVIFFDAFGSRVQPELWVKPILQNCYDMLSKHGVWVTYSCKGSVRRDLEDIGFKVEKIAGPPGKREMLRAIKF
ncbi:tRNA (5-methylaminomethyl-2-thiouridine)(34)-methyltransferase MnmD [Flavobacteriaceae bacterium 14752]|uniref:tRNA (5-methylaminomethyl-2-thiouridine)(34)-methyltransferase MnmD n=1 Tax=Mesohalobacter salilacus TaxID=2491711 RepID=UPI000F634245|nr:SAM-dependent methyltransferase [Flavobacteriaceae bacterium 14752]